MSAYSNSHKATILCSLLGVAAVGCLVVIAPAIGQAQSALPPSFTDFPMIGVGVGQTLAVNVTNGLTHFCDAVVGFYDHNGNQIGDLQAVSVEDNPGSHFPRGNLIARKALPIPNKFRGEFRPVVIPAPGTTSVCYATAEIYDNSTESSLVFLPGAQPPGPTPPPASPTFPGTVGVNLFQTVRLNVVARPTDPCFGVLSFASADGSPIAATKTVSLNPGRAAYLDLPRKTVVTGRGRRAEVQPIFTPTVGTAPGLCTISVEVYNNVSGWTSVIFVPPPDAD